MDDGGRAKRARQRAEEERRELEQRTSEREEAASERNQELMRLHRDSCHPLSGTVSTVNVFLIVVFTGIGSAVGMPLLLEVVPAVAKLLPGPLELIAPVALIFVVAFVALFARIAVVSAAKRRYRAELAWMRNLPFAVDDLDRGVITSSSHRHLVIVIPNARPSPGIQIMSMLTHVDPGGSVETRYDELRIKARVAGEPESLLGRVRARRLLFHDLVDGVLLPLHVQMPFPRIKTESD